MTQTWDTEELERVIVNDELLYARTRHESETYIRVLIESLSADYPPVSDSEVNLDLVNWDYLEKELE